MVYNHHDTYYRKAKQEGYRSRAAYKLIELQRHFHLLKPGEYVVDLGAAPGGWLQVAGRCVGVRGKVIGVDTQPMEPFSERNIIVLQGDITAEQTQQQIEELLGGPVHCVISDLAPKLSGVRDADAAHCLELNQTALRLALRLLRPKGSLLVKSFIGNDLHPFSRELKKFFRVVDRTRPEATRKASSEVYFCAKDFRPMAVAG